MTGCWSPSTRVWVLNSKKLWLITGGVDLEGRDLSFLKALTVKLQRSAILRDSANDSFWSSGRHIGLNLDSDLYLRIKYAGKMLNY